MTEHEQKAIKLMLSNDPSTRLTFDIITSLLNGESAIATGKAHGVSRERVYQVKRFYIAGEPRKDRTPK